MLSKIMRFHSTASKMKRLIGGTFVSPATAAGPCAAATRNAGSGLVDPDQSFRDGAALRRELVQKPAVVLLQRTLRSFAEGDHAIQLRVR